jgi:predicted nucleic acid-binding protein
LDVGVKALRDHLRQWLEAVQRGEEVTVTERGKPVAPQEAGSDLAGAVWDSMDRAVTSRIACVEARAALAAGSRSGRVAGTGQRARRRALEASPQAMDLIDVTPEIVRAAGDLAETHALPGYDAVHLASSLTLDLDDAVLVTWDRDLARAGHALGLDLAGTSLE